MAVATSTIYADDPVARPVSSASKGVAAAASEPAVGQAPTEASADMLQSISRMIYSGSYALAYGLVYATVFVAQSLPQENPVMHGFRDGGRAAMDELGES
jgi:hypothetical protein